MAPDTDEALLNRTGAAMYGCPCLPAHSPIIGLDLEIVCGHPALMNGQSTKPRTPEIVTISGSEIL